MTGASDDAAPARLRWPARVTLPPVLLVVSVLLGVALRLREYAFDRSLWLDEYSLANNITARGFVALTRPLADAQAAPVGFLWLSRLSCHVFGDNELALRLVPVLGSLVSVVVFALLAHRVVGGWAAAVATFLFAVSPDLIVYSSEVKQYSTDVMATVLLLYATVLLGRRPPWSHALAWGLLAAVLVWLSQPAIPVAFVCALIVAVRSVRAVRDLVPLLPGAALLAVAVAVEYHVSLREQAGSSILQSYWHLGYPPRHGSTLRWLGGDLQSLLSDPIALRHTTVALVLVVVGAIALLVRRSWSPAALLLSPVLLGILLAIHRDYPLRQRLALYLLPVLLLLLAGGLVVLAPPRRGTVAASPPGRAAAAAVSVLVLVGIVVTSYGAIARGATILGRPVDITAGREAIGFIAAHQQPGDAVVAEYTWAGQAITYYGPRAGVHETGTFGYAAQQPGVACDPARQLRFPAGTRRVWVLFAHHASNQPADRTAIYLSWFEQLGTVEDSYTGAGQAGAYLVDLARPPTTPPPLRAPTWTTGCLTIRGPQLIR